MKKFEEDPLFAMTSDEYKRERAKILFLFQKQLKKENLQLSKLYNGKVDSLTITAQDSFFRKLEFNSEAEFTTALYNPNNTIEDFIHLLNHARQNGYVM
jgi:hypothetical protein